MILAALPLYSAHLLHVGDLSFVSKHKTEATINGKLNKLELVRSNTLPRVPTKPQLSQVGNKFEAANSLRYLKGVGQLQVVQVASFMACVSIFVTPSAAAAVDTLQTYNCLLKGCRIEFAKCLSDPSCAANIACIEICNNRPDQTECQMRCGDLFQNNVVDEFNKCVVTRKKCVPQKPDNGEYPVPNSNDVVKKFNIDDFSGEWYITSGLNPTFDPFDCQLHEFHTESGKLVGTLSWRVKTPGNGFLTRSRVQRFVQEPNRSVILHYYDDEYLHSQDHWYILSSRIENKSEDYVFVYYRGSNDAWDGYGGAIVYTRTATLPESIIPELKRAARRIGRDFDQFIRTDNTCRSLRWSSGSKMWWRKAKK